MKTIFYSLPGEGLGHAGRTHAIIERLNEFQVHLFTWGEAWEYFHKQNYPYLHKIIGIPFGRTDNKISIVKTVKNFISYCWNFKDSVRYIANQAKRLNPCLFISDFEGVLPVAAAKFRRPLLSIDNQHKFSRTIDKDIPWDLRFHAFFMGLYAEWICHKPDLALVSTFYHSAVKKKYCSKTLLTNCFMRTNIDEIEPTTGDYVLVYYKPSVGQKMLESLLTIHEKVVVFNCPPDETIGNFEYHNVSNEKFIKALAGCKAVFCASGNQLLGEAAYYGKPILTIPEPNQPEQRINAYYVKKMGYGVSAPLHKFNTQIVVDFLSNLHKYGNNVRINGVHVALEQIRKYATHDPYPNDHRS